MRQFELDSLDLSLMNVESTVNTLIDESNTLTTSLYNTIYKATNDIQGMKKKVSILGDMITDLSVINGKTKNTVYLSDLDVYSSSGIAVEDGSISLGKLNDTTIEYSTKESTILSSKPIFLSGTTGRAKTIEEVFKYKTKTDISVANIGYDLTFVLKYAKNSKINQLTIELPLDAPSYPLLEDIKITGPNNLSLIPVKITKNNSYNFSLDENRVVGNIYKVDIEPIDARELQFTLSSKTESKLSIVSISTSYNTYESYGEVILGPIVSETPILKVGMTSVESSNNVKLSISPDLETWIDMLDSFRISTDDVRKVVAFNTINESSLKSDTPVNSLYVRVILESKPLDSILNSLSYDAYREENSVSNNVLELVEDNRFSAFRVKADDFAYGIDMYTTGTEITKNLKKEISSLRINGATKLLGFDDTSFSIGQRASNQNNVSVTLKHLRLPASSDIDASVFDSVGSELYDIILVPLKGNINVLSEKNVCLKLIKKEDDYKLISKETKRFIDISITSGFINSSYNALIQVPNEDMILVDSLGKVIREFYKDNHLEVKDGDEVVSFISLIGVLYQLPKVGSLVPNPLYPIEALGSNEYSVEDGQIVLGQGSIVTVDGYKKIKTKVNKRLDISYQNGNVWERLDPLYTYRNMQVDTSAKETTIIKLDHRSIEKGSLEIFEYNSYESVGNEDNTFIAVSNSYLNDGNYITEEQGTGVYLEE